MVAVTFRVEYSLIYGPGKSADASKQLEKEKLVAAEDVGVSPE